MAKQDYKELLDRYFDLDEYAQMIMRLLAVIYEPTNQSTVNFILKSYLVSNSIHELPFKIHLRTMPVKPKTPKSQQLSFHPLTKSLRKKLERKKIINFTKGGQLQCAQLLKSFLTHEAVLLNEFEGMKSASVQHITLQSYGYDPYLDNVKVKRQLHYAVHQNKTREIMNLLNIREPYSALQLNEEHWLMEVCANPLDTAVFEYWPPWFQYQVLNSVLKTSLLHWSDATPFFELLETMLVNADPPVPVLALYAEQCMIRGEWLKMQRSLAKLDTVQGDTLRACLLFLQGEDDAVDAFKSVLARIRKDTRKRRIAIPGLPGVIYLMALLRDQNIENRKLADQQISAMEKLGGQESHFNGAAWQLRLAREINEGRLAFTPVSDINFNFRYSNALLILLMGLSHYWNNATLDKALSDQFIASITRAENAGYRWFARECECLAAAFANADIEVEGSLLQPAEGSLLQPAEGSLLNPAEGSLLNPAEGSLLNPAEGSLLNPAEGSWGPPLTELIPRIEDWERSLNALVSIGSPEAAGESRMQDETRLVWFLQIDEFSDDYTLQPKEQKRRQNGTWTSGRKISLKRLVEDPASMTLSEADRKICQMIYIEKDYYTMRFKNYLAGVDALLAAAGHPHLYSSRNLPAEITHGQPELIVTELGNSINLTMAPFPDGKNNLIVSETPEKLKIYLYTENLLHVARILTREGLQVPQSARDKVLESVSSIAPLLTVHSNMDGITETTAISVAADPRLYVHLLPRQSGMLLSFFVQPFGDGPLLKPGHGGKQLFAEIGGMSLTTSRDLDAEGVLLESVLAACPALNERSPDEWCWDEMEDALEGLLTLKTFAEDLVLQWPEGKELTLSQPVNVSQMSVSLRERKDWFEIEGELQVDTDQLYSMRSLLELMDAGNSRFVQLADGQFLTLTDTLRRRLEVLKNIEHDGRIHALHAQNIEDSIDGMAVKADTGWEQQVQRLQAARDIDPQLPATVDADLRDYQTQGYKWLCRLAEWGAGACLADDMGLGKTLQSLALLVKRAGGGPALVLSPTSVCANWIEESHRFTPTLNPIRFGDGDRSGTLDALTVNDVLICSYGLLQTESEALQEIQWHTIVADEAQAFKNATTKRSKAVMGLSADFRMIATGTPIENHLGELWNLFNFINPGLLGSRETFNNKFAYPIENQKNRHVSAMLKQLISPFILRRLKRDVLTELPPLTEITIHVELSEQETALYEALRIEAVEQLSNIDLKAGQQRIQALASITRLRRAVCNPNLVLKDANLPSAKLEAFADIVDELLSNQHRALVFSQFVGHLSLIRDYLDRQGTHYCYLDGSTPTKQRKVEIDAFQAGEAELFLISLKAGGVGLNLTAADYVIHMDPWWNPAVEDQASDRAHRIGQQRPVTVYRLVTTHTIEEKIVDLHAHKRDLADSLLEGAEVSARMSVDDMLALLDY